MTQFAGPTQTPSERNTLMELGVGAQNIVLLGMGVDAQECSGGDRGRARRAWGVTNNEIVIGHLANNSREKGTVDLLAAAECLWQRGMSFRIVLAGPEMPNFQRYWRRYRPRGPVVKLGVIDDAQKRDFFAGIDVFALPSRSDSFGLVLLEAWVNGVPNIAYRAGGIADVIRSGEDGMLVPCGDVPALAAGLECLIRDTALRQRMGQIGKKRVEAEFGWAEKLERVRNVYQKLTERRE
jgi:glycosyltransferase involved in cell wall biosynthesis